MGFAEVEDLEALAEENEGGSGMKFSDFRAQENEATHNMIERSREDKTKLARAMSGKIASVRSKTSTVAKKGAMKVYHFIYSTYPRFFASLSLCFPLPLLLVTGSQ